MATMVDAGDNKKSSALQTMVRNWKYSEITNYLSLTIYIHRIWWSAAVAFACSVPSGCTIIPPSTPKVPHESGLNLNWRRMRLSKYQHRTDQWDTLILGGLHRSETEKRVVCVSSYFTYMDLFLIITPLFVYSKNTHLMKL